MFLDLGLSLGRGGRRPRRFYPVTNKNLSTVITSNWAYFTVATGTAFTVDGAEVTFNGVDWLSVDGVTPAGAKRWKVRGESSEDYETAVTYTPTLDSVDYPFVITTRVDPALFYENYTDEENYTELENYVD